MTVKLKSVDLMVIVNVLIHECLSFLLFKADSGPF